MKITNKLNLPAPFVAMAQRDYDYELNEYHVTSLLKGIRETLLERRHADEIEQDVSDMVWLLFGTAVHNILEKYECNSDELQEERIKINFGDYVLSGKFDLYSDNAKIVTDYKTASVWKIIYGDYKDWRQQLLIYCYMLRQIGFDAQAGQIIAFLKDHSKREAKQNRGYPQYPVQVIPFNFIENDFVECEKWLNNKFAEIKACENLPDDELPLCTPEERYNSGETYAVMKKGRKKALRVLDNMQDAEQWMEQNGGDWIAVRPGEDKKCIDYCSACKFCNYYNEVVIKNDGDKTI